MEIHVQCSFATSYQAFKSCSHTIDHVTQLITTLRDHSSFISYEAKHHILQIPLHVLKYECDSNASTQFSKDFGGYFSGNIPYPSDTKLLEFKNCFGSGSYTLDTMVEFLEYLISKEELLCGNSEFYLRNPEVTIRDFITISSPEKFKEHGLIYSRFLEQAFNM